MSKKVFCPLCGQEMKAQFKDKVLQEAVSEVGSMKLNPAAVNWIQQSFFGDFVEEGAIRHSWVKGPLYCPVDGLQMVQAEKSGEIVRTAHKCAKCQRTYTPALLQILSQEHKHT